MAIVTKTMEEIKREMTPERIHMETERVKSMPIVYDEDCPPQTEEELRMFKRAVPRKCAV